MILARLTDNQLYLFRTVVELSSQLSVAYFMLATQSLQ